MKNNQFIILGVFLIIIAFFGGKNYESFKSNPNEIYTKLDSVDIKAIKDKITKERNAKKSRDLINNSKIPNKTPETVKAENKKVETKIEVRKSVQSKNILKFKSAYNDFENSTDILETNYEISYHTFDFDNKTITMKSKTKSGNWKTFVFNWTKITETYDNRYIEFTIKNDKGVYQIWRSSMNNIGYEFYNNTKLVYYDVQQIN